MPSKKQLKHRKKMANRMPGYWQDVAFTKAKKVGGWDRKPSAVRSIDPKDYKPSE